MSETANPFEPPKADWSRDEPDEYEDELGDLVAARQGTRLANAVLDNLFQVMMATMVALLMRDPAWIYGAFFLYHLLFEAIFYKTPAKWITRTRVVTKHGRRPRFMQLLGRTFVRYIPFEALSFLGRKASGWHDTWSGTRVVYDSPRRSKRRRRRRAEASE
jgi:uncharacterized RDD family membrane protein YckC